MTTSYVKSPSVRCDASCRSRFGSSAGRLNVQMQTVMCVVGVMTLGVDVVVIEVNGLPADVLATSSRARASCEYAIPRLQRAGGVEEWQRDVHEPRLQFVDTVQIRVI